MKKEIIITCTDGIQLSGTIFTPTKVKGAVMIAPATGIKRRFYQSFATFLAKNGFGVITFDNRGIGDSKGKSLNSVNASLINWGKLDMTAVFEELNNQFKDTSYHLVGHSAGGQLVGLMENAQELTSMFNFASSSGSIHYASYPFKIKSVFFLNFFIPLSNLFFGHTKSQWLGMGEPLPKKVASEWSKWCNGKGYVKVDLDKKIKTHLYNDLKMPSLWLHATDDDIANAESVPDMIRVYPNIQSEIIALNPKEYNFKDIGHMKFFSSKRKELWSFALDWLEKKS